MVKVIRGIANELKIFKLHFVAFDNLSDRKKLNATNSIIFFQHQNDGWIYIYIVVRRSQPLATADDDNLR